MAARPPAWAGWCHWPPSGRVGPGVHRCGRTGADDWRNDVWTHLEVKTLEHQSAWSTFNIFQPVELVCCTLKSFALIASKACFRLGAFQYHCFWLSSVMVEKTLGKSWVSQNSTLRSRIQCWVISLDMATWAPVVLSCHGCPHLDTIRVRSHDSLSV